LLELEKKKKIYKDSLKNIYSFSHIMDTVGGQAVIEGVLIKNGNKVATAVRDPQGNIKIKEETHKSVTKKNKLLGLPFIRGPIILAETMVLGLKALNYSANVSVEEEGEEDKLGTATMILTLLFSLAVALFLFKFLPLGAAEMASQWHQLFQGKYLYNLTEGIVKIGILILYITAIGFMPDVRRVFQYHGAEHKVVNAYENSDLENAKKYGTLHVRCGTSFILFVLSLSIIVYLIIPVDLSFWAKYGIRLLLLPVIAGIGFELIKISPQYEKYWWFNAVISPGLWLQKLTTREPDEKQLEVALKAIKKVI
jgi:uncharacterized protein YqhQ